MKAISKIRKGQRLKFPHFFGNLNLEELIDWRNDIEEYFEYEVDLKRVKFAKIELKGHANIGWKEVQLQRNRKGKENITKRDQMVEKMKRECICVDYDLDLLKKMQGLRQAGKSIKWYTKVLTSSDQNRPF